MDEGVGGLPDAAFRRIVDTLSVPVLVVAEDGTIRYAGGTCERDLGWHPDVLPGRNILEFIPPDQIDDAIQSMADLTSHAELGIGVPTVYAVTRPDGELTWHAVGAAPLLDDPDVRGTSFFLLPWDAQLHFDESISALLAGRDLDRVLVHLARSITISLEALGVIVHHGFDGTDFTAETGFGVPRVCLEGSTDSPWRRAVTSGEAQYVEVGTLAEPARAAAEELGIGGVWAIPLPASRGIEPAALSVWRRQALAPVTAHDFVVARSLRYVQLTLLRTAEHAQLAYMATHDPLTGAANRSLFNRRLAEALEAGQPTVVLFCDLDEFKAINDTFGHTVGDAVLVEATKRIRRVLRSEDELARIGGDEFTVLFDGPAHDAALVAERMVAALAEPLHVGGTQLHVALSVGVAVADARSTPDSLLNQADDALYAAKRAGGGCIRVATPPPA